MWLSIMQNIPPNFIMKRLTIIPYVRSEEHTSDSSDLGGGWLTSLNKELQEHVELHVAFYYAKYSPKFYYEKTYYYPICKQNWKLEILKRLLYNPFVDKKDMQIYLSLIKQIQPDIIHIHGTENPFSCIIDEVEIPIVVSVQGNISVILKKFCSGIEKEYLSVDRKSGVS